MKKIVLAVTLVLGSGVAMADSTSGSQALAATQSQAGLDYHPTYSTTTRGSDLGRNVPSIAIGGFGGGANPCVVGQAIGGSGSGFSFGISTAYNDEECQLRSWTSTIGPYLEALAQQGPSGYTEARRILTGLWDQSEYMSKAMGNNAPVKRTNNHQPVRSTGSSNVTDTGPFGY